ncbi:MAG: hypothetical protein N2260_04215 [Syntrophobacterales bacterium]|nr:hypothetical protein [Syntrophobacterales bacterium]
MKKSYIMVFICLLGITTVGKVLAQCPKELGGKKVAVIVGSSSADVTPDLIKDIETIFENQLLGVGFQVINQSLVEKIIPEQEKQLLLRGDTVGAVKLSEKLGADLLFVSQLSVRTSPIEGVKTNLKSVYVTLGLKLLSAKTAQAISSKTWTGKSAGSEISKTTLGLVEKNSEVLTRAIYEEYCQRGAVALSVGSSSPSTSSRLSGEKEGSVPSAEGPGEVPTREGPKNEITPKPSTNLENL